MNQPQQQQLIAELFNGIRKLKLLASLVTVKQVISAGDKAIDAAGLNPWCLNEGQATGDERIDISRVFNLEEIMDSIFRLNLGEELNSREGNDNDL